jgi:glycosyltransferase involved in cell wall biosynthesis
VRLKVLHIINSLSTGGAEILLTNSLSPGGLSEHTENYLAYFKNGDYLHSQIDKSVQQFCLDYKGGLDIVRLLRQLRRIMITYKIDIVHTHLNPAGVYTHLVCPRQIPQVHTIHTTYSKDTETSWVKKTTEKYLYLQKRNSNVILLSDYTQKDFLSSVSFKGKSFILNNFVADDFFAVPEKKFNPANRRLNLVAAGTLKPLKNHVYLLEVFKHLKGYNISLDIYGGGDKTALQKVIQENELPVRLMGHSDKFDAVIGAYDLFIMPSIFEGFPLSVFEAMAANVPVMLSNITPLTSIVKEHAIYFELDNAAQTAAQITAIYNGQININTIAEAAKTYAQNIAARETYIKSLLKIYEDLRH